MGLETAKAYKRRLDIGIFDQYLLGYGIDIGCGTDVLQVPLFIPNTTKFETRNLTAVDPWDLPQGDAQLMLGVPDNKYDFVYSSHCLEHMRDPVVALRNWVRICKPGGYIFTVVPDEDLYEQGIWPSRFNGDHKSTWSIFKPVGKSWSPVSVNVMTLPDHIDGIVLIDAYKVDTNYDFDLMNKHFGTTQSVDQSGGNTEVGIEFILQKVT